MEPAQTEYFRRVLFAAEPVTFQNLKDPDDDNRLMRVKPHSNHSGRVRGRLIGGNLSVFCHSRFSPAGFKWGHPVF